MVVVKIIGWVLLLVGVLLLWPLLGPLLTIALTLISLAAALLLGAVLLSFGWVVALLAILVGLLFAAIKWALPLGIILLGIWLLSADREKTAA